VVVVVVVAAAAAAAAVYIVSCRNYSMGAKCPQNALTAVRYPLHFQHCLLVFYLKTEV